MPGGRADDVDIRGTEVFWQLVSRRCGGFSIPAKYGFSGCMPATVKSAEGINSAGISGADGTRLWSRARKNSMNVCLISSEVMGVGV